MEIVLNTQENFINYRTQLETQLEKAKKERKILIEKFTNGDILTTEENERNMELVNYIKSIQNKLAKFDEIEIYDKVESALLDLAKPGITRQEKDKKIDFIAENFLLFNENFLKNLSATTDTNKEELKNLKKILSTLKRNLVELGMEIRILKKRGYSTTEVEKEKQETEDKIKQLESYQANLFNEAELKEQLKIISLSKTSASTKKTIVSKYQQLLQKHKKLAIDSLVLDFKDFVLILNEEPEVIKESNDAPVITTSVTDEKPEVIEESNDAPIITPEVTAEAPEDIDHDASERNKRIEAKKKLVKLEYISALNSINAIEDIEEKTKLLERLKSIRNPLVKAGILDISGLHIIEAETPEITVEPEISDDKTPEVTVESESIDNETPEATVEPESIDNETPEVTVEPESIDNETPEVTVEPKSIDDETPEITVEPESIDENLEEEPEFLDGNYELIDDDVEDYEYENDIDDNSLAGKFRRGINRFNDWLVDDRVYYDRLDNEETLGYRTKQKLKKVGGWLKKSWKPIAKVTGAIILGVAIISTVKSCDKNKAKNETNTNEFTTEPTIATTIEPTSETTYANTMINNLMDKGYSEYNAILMADHFEPEILDTVLSNPYNAAVENYATVKAFNYDYTNDYEEARTIYGITSEKAVDYVNRSHKIMETGFYTDLTINEIVGVVKSVDDKQIFLDETNPYNHSITAALTNIYNDYAFGTGSIDNSVKKIEALKYFAPEGSDLEAFLTNFTEITKNVLESRGNASVSEETKQSMYNYLNIFANTFAGNTQDFNNPDQSAVVTDTFDWNTAYITFIRPLMSIYITESNAEDFACLQINMLSNYEQWIQINGYCPEETITLG